MSPLTLETDRLVIRCFQPADLPIIHRILDQTFGDGRLANNAAALRERRDWLEWSILGDEWFDRLHQPPYGDRAITLKDSGELIGAIGYVPLLMPFEQMPGLGSDLESSRAPEPAAARFTPEIGLFWAIAPERQRRGFATEAARAMIAYAFQTLRLKRILANTDFANMASQGVMLKVGMRLARNPWPRPPWLQVIGVLDGPETAHE